MRLLATTLLLLLLLHVPQPAARAAAGGGAAAAAAAAAAGAVAQLEREIVAALFSGNQERSLEAIEVYRQHLTGQLSEVTMAQGLQAMFEMDHQPASMYSIMSLWLDSFGHVDAFYRAQEAVMLARIAQHERSTGHPAEAAGGGLFTRFSEEPVFRFFHPSLMFPADPAALALARGVNADLAEALLAVGDSSVGYIPELLAATHPPDQPTMNTCRHIKRLTLLLHQLQADRLVGSSKTRAWRSLRVAEIGGGNGNMARLVGAAPSLGFASWTIFDFPVMSRLQAWYLEQTLGSGGGGGSPQPRRYDVVRNLERQPGKPPQRKRSGSAAVAEDGRRGAVRLVDTRNFWSHLAELDAAAQPGPGSASNSESGAGDADWDVLIASHSWSELPLETFRMYLAALGGRYHYLLYCTQVEWPTSEEVGQKLRLLTEPQGGAGHGYEEVARLDSAHDGRPMLTLVFRRRGAPPLTGGGGDGDGDGGGDGDGDGDDLVAAKLAQLRALQEL